ncbi:cupin domain-containing protein [Niabella pedocola]|uniref:Cupin domain-containing protein n=1 Tax=Niabella pedocola TaxID=1752077 RepID=A0ABS8PP65_9BACT|nr:cupin domain-containing protein [Niabella pedocola]MCD2421596.1 cupin domain-containing protein [Niabella pedocola]
MIETFKATATTDNSRWYMGHLFTWLVTAKQTGGKFSILEATIRKGLEPPAHIHAQESETYYILKGVMRFFVGDKVFKAQAGDCVYLPVNVQHSFTLETETAKCIILIEPGGLEDFFAEFSIPAPELQLPPMPSEPPAPELIRQFVAALATYGVTSPAEAVEAG